MLRAKLHYQTVYLPGSFGCVVGMSGGGITVTVACRGVTGNGGMGPVTVSTLIMCRTEDIQQRHA